MIPAQQTHTTSELEAAGHSLTRPQRRELMRLLLLARGVERVLASLRGRPLAPGSEHPDHALTATVAAAALGGDDLLIAPQALLVAHLARGLEIDDLAAARLGEPRRVAASGDHPLVGIGPQSPVGIAVGAALARDRDCRPGVVVALADGRWALEPTTTGALELARDLALPLVVVSIGGDAPDTGSRVVDGFDFDAVYGASREALEEARADPAWPRLVACVATPSDPSRHGDHVARYRTRIDDPVTSYERWLMINGFPRSELDAIRATATGELDAALGDRLARALEKRAVFAARRSR